MREKAVSEEMNENRNGSMEKKHGNRNEKNGRQKENGKHKGNEKHKNSEKHKKNRADRKNRYICERVCRK